MSTRTTVNSSLHNGRRRESERVSESDDTAVKCLYNYSNDDTADDDNRGDRIRIPMEMTEQAGLLTILTVVQPLLAYIMATVVLEGWWPLTDNTILHLLEMETGGVRLLGHRITSPPEQRRIVGL